MSSNAELELTQNEMQEVEASHHEHTEHVHRDDFASKMGMWLFLLTELLLFGGLFILYMAYRFQYSHDFHIAAKELNVGVGTLNTIILLTSSLSMALSIIALQKGNKKLSINLLWSTVGLAGFFMVNKFFEWSAMAGGDLATLRGNPVQGAADLLVPLNEALELMTSIDAPVIAQIHGLATGAGAASCLASASSFRRLQMSVTACASTSLWYWRPASCIFSTSQALRNTSTISLRSLSLSVRSLSSSDSRMCVVSVISVKPKVPAPPLIECAVRKIAFKSSLLGAPTSSSSSNRSISPRSSADSSKNTS